jgi:hypothetical protein
MLTITLSLARFFFCEGVRVQHSLYIVAMFASTFFSCIDRNKQILIHRLSSMSDVLVVFASPILFARQAVQV